MSLEAQKFYIVLLMRTCLSRNFSETHQMKTQLMPRFKILYLNIVGLKLNKIVSFFMGIFYNLFTRIARYNSKKNRYNISNIKQCKIHRPYLSLSKLYCKIRVENYKRSRFVVFSLYFNFKFLISQRPVQKRL